MPTKVKGSSYNEKQRFCVTVLWYHGLNQTKVASMASKYSKVETDIRAVRSILASCGLPPRSSMNNADINDSLSELRRKRGSNGGLPGWCFLAKGSQIPPHPRTKARRSKKLSGPGYDGKMSVNFSNKQEKTIGSIQNNFSDPVEFFEANSLLNDQGTTGQDNRRCRAARRFRETWEGAQVSRLSSVDLEREGGSGFGPSKIPDYRVDCWKLRQYWQKRMPEATWAVLEDCFAHGNFVFFDDRNRIRGLALEQIRYGLDIICWLENDFDGPEMKARWPAYFKWESKGKIRRS